MHLLVTDRLACVRCGPTFGLILFAERLVERRVLDGVLGCANCRDRYPVQEGFGDFRPQPRDALPQVPLPRGEPAENAFRLAALLGVTEGPGLILMTGISAVHASRLVEMIEGVEIVAAHPGLQGREEEPGVSRIATGDRLPFSSGSLRGVVVDGDGPWVRPDLAEAVRVLGRGARLVVRSPVAEVTDRVGDAGLDLLLESERFVVAARG